MTKCFDCEATYKSEVVLCPLHRAASDLLEACKMAFSALDSGSVMPEHALLELGRAIKQAEKEC